MDFWFYVLGLALIVIGILTLSFWLVIAGIVCFIVPSMW